MTVTTDIANDHLYPGGYYICFLKGLRVTEKTSAGRQCGQ